MLELNRAANPPVRPVTAGAGVHILLVGEDRPWRTELSAYLEDEGFRVLLASGPDEAETVLPRSPSDLVILQTRSCGAGLSLCRRLSAQDGAPVILVSDRARDIDRIVGLEVGADDFVSPDCSHRELLARIRAVLRRRARPAPTALGAPPAAPDRAPVRFAGWALSPWRLEVEAPDGHRSLLSPSEFKLLSALLEYPGETITRQQMALLLELPDANPRSLDTAVCRLRRKLGYTPAGEPVIRTVHGVGYMLNGFIEPEEPSSTAMVVPRGRQTAR